MNDILISRDRECNEIKRCLNSSRSEFIIIGGRRRIGKTYLIDTYFKRKFDFTFVGEHNTPAKVQIDNFMRALEKQSGRKIGKATNWYTAFNALEDYLESLPKRRKKVVFIDEMPWIDTLHSTFVSALENFWNGWANRRTDIVLIATGSATSWMADKIEANKGGLHARITCKIHLSPFTLKETEEYLKKRKFKWQRYQIAQCYMLFGGVPFYLSLLNPEESLVQNVDRLFFSYGAQLRNEFDELYTALFNHAESYISIVRLLSTHKEGLTREEISKETSLQGTFLTKVLRNLVQCDFVSLTSQFGTKKNDAIYRLTDLFTLFHYKFLEENHSQNARWWSENHETQSVKSWMGLSFELVCMLHSEQIRNALGISGIRCDIYTWKFKGDKKTDGKGFQIDMVIKRADDTVNLCEMKFSRRSYDISNDYEERLRNRETLFDMATGKKYTILNTFVTTYGVTDGKYKSIVDSEVTMDDLFNS